MKYLTTQITKVALLTTILATVLVVNYIQAWTSAPANPPSGNVTAPITVGSASQVKNGSLGVNALAVYGDTSLSNLTVTSGRVYFGDNQYLHGDNSSALSWYGAHDTVTQLLMRDAQGTVYGRLYGSGDGTTFGLMDGDANWSYVAVKDNYTDLRINNSVIMRLKSNGQVGIGDTTPNGSLKLDVEGYVGADKYCDQNGSNCFEASYVTAAPRCKIQFETKTTGGSCSYSGSYSETSGLTPAGGGWGGWTGWARTGDYGCTRMRMYCQ